MLIIKNNHVACLPEKTASKIIKILLISTVSCLKCHDICTQMTERALYQSLRRRKPDFRRYYFRQTPGIIIFGINRDKTLQA